MLGRNKKCRLVCGIGCVCMVLLYWFWFSSVTDVATGHIEWEGAKKELNTAAWRKTISRKGNNKTEGCTYPKLDPWSPEVMKYVSSIPQVRYYNLIIFL